MFAIQPPRQPCILHSMHASPVFSVINRRSPRPAWDLELLKGQVNGFVIGGIGVFCKAARAVALGRVAPQLLVFRTLSTTFSNMRIDPWYCFRK
jgi:hypothetical protein